MSTGKGYIESNIEFINTQLFNFLESNTEFINLQSVRFQRIFKKLQEIIYKISAEKGFHSDYINNSVPVKLALIHSEISEALECDRIGKQHDKHCPEHHAITIELADAVIRIMDLAEMLDLPLIEGILAKVSFNASRPQMHGSKKY
jgi:NTP pyrophosphatase (non-canonical NTP hydrolase)